jgi:DNA-binding transcriptional MerR regulator
MILRMALYRIGTAARLSGVEIATLRNWERRYGVVVAMRNDGRQRLYSREDIDRLRLIKRWIDHGLSAGEAHALARERTPETALKTQELTGSRVRADARRLRAEVAATRARSAAAQAQAARSLSALAERAAVDNRDFLPGVADDAHRRQARTRAVAPAAAERVKVGDTGS